MRNAVHAHLGQIVLEILVFVAMAVADAQNRRIDLGLLDLLPIDVSLMFGDVDDPPYRPQHAAIPLGEHMYAERIRPRSAASFHASA